MKNMNPYLDLKICALVANFIRTAKFRHHGIGCLQSYVLESDWPLSEYRVHIWHPLLKTVPEGQGDIHDHKFTLFSQVLYGSIIETVYDCNCTVPELSTHDRYVVQNARAAGEDKNYDGYCKKEEKTFELSISRQEIYSDCSYALDSGYAHKSMVRGITITLVRKIPEYVKRDAVVYCEKGKTLVHAFDKERQANDHFIHSITDEAVNLLSEKARLLRPYAL